jgi:crossover junction endodeoxyribonuclease RuvC
MRRYLGIDPGLSGALATLTVADDGTQELGVTATPVDWFQVGSAKRRRYAIDRCRDELVLRQRTIALAYIEHQSAFPGQGVTSMFSTGFGFGMWLALLTASYVPFAIVSPVRWRRKVGLAAGTGQKKRAIKAAVRLAACQRFPTVRINLDHADAVMLAVAAALEHGTNGGTSR